MLAIQPEVQNRLQYSDVNAWIISATPQGLSKVQREQTLFEVHYLKM
jgi:hypothetical protein